ncbi:hypothetical protein NDU88_000951 [Pleurodeles waltl]|uniref:Uncharacterized protein n=1 Tax=Pleurodeles waltl TaxID=8319 RepID=A0AAV7TH69_PLEWA|nr:hypothetical protein NDU88_000951 [Pleurodeles waltl]
MPWVALRLSRSGGGGRRAGIPRRVPGRLSGFAAWGCREGPGDRGAPAEWRRSSGGAEEPAPPCLQGTRGE